MAERRHGFKPVNPRGEDEAYDRMRDRELEERPPADKDILKALFDTLPMVLAKEEAGRFSGITNKGKRRQDDHE
jgi:hypothetical protein